jgi:hypothetical protein
VGNREAQTGRPLRFLSLPLPGRYLSRRKIIICCNEYLGGTILHKQDDFARD